MATRSLFEIDHDKFGSIEQDPQGFVRDLLAYLRNPASGGGSPFPLPALDLRYNYGVEVYGTRHHSAPVHISYGYTFRIDRPNG